MRQLLAKIPWQGLLVALILAVFVAVRCYRLTTPLADWHSARQADTAAVARNFASTGINLLYPQSDSLWALSEHQLPNPHRYFMNEFPLYNAVVALIYRAFGVNHVYAREVSIAVSTLGALYLYLLTRRLLGVPLALLSLLYYALLPYNIYYNRVVMPDPTMASFSIISLYYALLYAANLRTRDGLLLSLSFAVATLVKPYAVFMLIPILYWLLQSRGLSLLKRPSSYLLLLLGCAPLLAWRYFLTLHPEGSFASHWLLNGDHIRFTGAYFRWLIFDRLNRLIFATGGFVLFVAGLFAAHQKKNSSLFFVWALAIALYMVVFAKGNVNHDYYQLPIVAPGVVLVMLGAKSLVGLARTRLAKYLNGALALSLLVLSLAFGWYEVRGYFNINNPAIVEAGARADALLPRDALVIAPYFGDPAFLYQTNRHGWPVGGNIEERIGEGASYYVTTSKDAEYHELLSRYQLVEQTDAYAIIHLVPPTLPPRP